MRAPTDNEKIMALSGAVALIEAGIAQLEAAGRSVVPQSPMCVLGRTENYDYQQWLQHALRDVYAARKIANDALRELVPQSCEWPSGHLGPFEQVPPFEDVTRCEACGKEWGK